MPSRDDYQYDVFISYSSENIDFIKEIVEFLNEVGVRCYYAPQDMRIGHISMQLRESIEKSMYFALFLSESTHESQWVTQEANYFINSRNIDASNSFVLIKISNGKMPMPIANVAPNNVQTFDINSDNFIGNIAKWVGKIIGSRYGILKYYNIRSHIPRRLWDILTIRANKEINLMGHALTPAFIQGRGLRVVLPVLKDDRKNVKMKVILLTPNIPRLQQIHELQMGLQHEGFQLKKINDTIEEIRKIKQEMNKPGSNNDPGLDSKLQVRITDRIMYSSVCIFDDLAIITNYSNIPEIGKNSPTFLVYNEGFQSLYSFYKDQFERYWNEGTHPEEEKRNASFDMSTRILGYRDKVNDIHNWMFGLRENLPPPGMLVVYPTYQCSYQDEDGQEQFICENCSYKQTRVGMEHIDFELLSSILDQAIDMGINNIELSGGGEPLQYRHIGDLLEKLEDIKNKNRNANIGILTNGLYINELDLSKFNSIFSYIRLSYAEGIMENPVLERRFKDKLTTVLGFNNWRAVDQPRIGLKVLLSRNNSRQLVSRLLSLKEDVDLKKDVFHRLNHIRVKAMRSRDQIFFEPTEEISRNFRNDFYDYLFVFKGQWPKDVAIDLDLRYVSPEFRCYLSPLLAVVDPCGSLLACCNYLNCYDDLKIGDLNKSKFSDIWGSQRHRDIVRSIDTNIVCNAKNGCPCRFVRYHEILTNPGDHTEPVLSNITRNVFKDVF